MSATTVVTIDLTSSAFDTYVCLFNGQNQILDSDDNSGSGTNSRLYRSLTTGTYFIEVTTRTAGGGGGAYTLSLQLGYPPGTPISVGQTSNGNLSAAAAKSSCLSSVPADRYQFSVSTTTVVTIDLTSSAFDTYVCLFNGQNQILDADDNSGSGTNSRFYRSLTTGSYFIEVTTRTAGGGGGAYTLSLQSGYPPGTSISVGQTPNGNLSAAAAKSSCLSSVPADRYQFSVSTTTVVTIDLTSSAFDTYVCLFNGQNQILDSDDNSGSGTNSRLYRSLTTGTYFIEVTTRTAGGGGGAYTLSLQSGYPPGTPVGLGQTLTGNLTSSAAKAACLFGAPADRYQFSVSTTTVVTIDLTSSAFDTYVCLFNGLNQLLDTDDNSGSGTNSRFYRSLTAGSYFIEVTTRTAGGGGGAYTLSLQSGYPPGTPVGLGQSLTGNLTSAAAKAVCRSGAPGDRYQFSLSASTAVSIAVTSSAFSPYLCLYNSQNGLIDANTSAISRTLAGTVPGTTYYVEVTTLSAGEVGGVYTVTGLTLQPSSGTQLSLTPTALAFSAAAGAAVVAPQQIAVSTSTAGAAFTTSAATTTGGSWLSVSPASGTTPGNVTVSVNASTLTAGAYAGSVTVRSPGATPPSIAVAVTLTVTAAAAQLDLDSTAMVFESLAGFGDPPSQRLRIRNLGAGSLAYTVQTSPSSPWLAVSSNSGTATSTAPGAVQVTANVAALAPGTYTGTITVQSGSQSQNVLVTLIITQPAQTILVSRSGLLYTGVEGGGALPAQSFGVLNAGRGTLSWTAGTTGASWLSVSPASGASDAASTTVPQVEVRVDSTGLTPGSYSGTVQVSAAGAVNSPQTVTVFLTVLPSGGNPGVQVDPTGLIFVSSGTQTVSLAKAAPGSLTVTAAVSTASGGAWLTVAPPTGSLAPGAPLTLNLQTSSGTLAAGIYQGTVTLTFGDGTSKAVNVLQVVPSPTEASKAPGAAACTPSQLVTVIRSIGNNFSSVANWPANIEALVVDNCGTARADATVVATFSNGDPPLVLVSLKNGTYSATWRPLTQTASMTLKVRATLGTLTPVEAQVGGAVAANASAPVLYPGGIVNAASFAAGSPLAPGSIVSLFGAKMAATGAAASLPLPTTLGNTTLKIGDTLVPLYVSTDGQINAQVPYELTAPANYQMVLRTPTLITVPEPFNLSLTRPGIFTTNQQGTGQGVVLNTNQQVVDSANPAGAGDVVVIYTTGLGATNPAVKSGEGAPTAEPLARVVDAVTATVGGQNAPVQFAGLTPGFVGLYQVNVQIPAGIAPGSAVNLVLTQRNVPSNTVTIGLK